MPSNATITTSLSVNDGSKDTVKESTTTTIALALPNNGKRETVSLAAASFTALSPPTGSKGVLIMAGTLVSCTIKGVTGDTGVAIQAASANNIPVLLPLGTTPSIGILNNGAIQSVEVIWF